MREKNGHSPTLLQIGTKNQKFVSVQSGA